MGQLPHCQGLQSLFRLINQEVLRHHSLLKWPSRQAGRRSISLEDQYFGWICFHFLTWYVVNYDDLR